MDDDRDDCSDNGRDDTLASILLETPPIEEAYMYLLVEPVDRAAKRSWRVVFIHDMAPSDFEKTWSSSYEEMRAAHRLHRLEYQYRSTIYVLLIKWGIDQYMMLARITTREIGYRIEQVSEDLQNDQSDPLSEFIRRLNNLSHEIHSLDLDRQFHFNDGAVMWGSDLLKHRFFYREARDLEEQLTFSERATPEGLLSRISEIRSHISNITAQQKQSVAEDQRRREQRLQDLSISIAEATRRDSRTMRGIAWVTIAFLPATFITSFFGMNFFNGRPGTPAFDGASHSMWIFFAVALPVSIVVLTVFWWWDRKQEANDNAKAEGEGTRSRI